MKKENCACGVYGIFTPNGSAYVGSSVHIQQRFNEHRSMLSRQKHHSIRLQRAYNKHGDQLRYEILCECRPDELNQKEQEFINALGAKLNTTNFVNNVWASDEVRKKLTEVHQSKEWKESRRVIAKNSSTRWRSVECSNGKSYKNPTEAAMAFRARASGIKALLKTHQRGKLGEKFKYSDEEWKPELPAAERRLKTRVANGNLKHSEETRAKIRINKKGTRPSQKTVVIAAEKNSKAVIGVSIIDGAKVEYQSTKAAAEIHHGVSKRTAQSQICKCLCGAKNIAYGFKWAKSKRKEEERNAGLFDAETGSHREMAGHI